MEDSLMIGLMNEFPRRATDFATLEEALAAAIAMFDRNDHAAALALWDEIRALHPTDPNGFRDAAAALIRLGRSDEADALLANGQTRFPQDPDFAIERGRLARRGGDPASAAALFAALRLAAPDEITAYLEGAACLRDLGRFAVAEGILRDALARFPTEPEPAIEFARLIETRADWPQALTRWSAVTKSFPDEHQGYLGMSRALTALGRCDEAEAMLTHAVERIAADADLLIAHAWAAEHRNPGETLRRLESARFRFPDDPAPCFGIGAALRDLGRFDEADAILSATLERFPGHVDVLVNYARVAEERGEWAEAAQRWQQVRAAQPGLLEGYLGYAAALVGMARIEEADAVLMEAAREFPTNPDVLIDYARAAQRRADWQQAVVRWEAVRDRFPERIAEYAEMGVALRELGRFDDADALLRSAFERHPEDTDIRVNYAWVADHRGDWLEALRRWDDALERFPDDPSPWFGKGAALRELRRFDDADAVFAKALQRFPGHEDVLVNYARVAQQRGDWGEALMRWEAVYVRFPDHPEAMAGRDAALAELSGGDADVVGRPMSNSGTRGEDEEPGRAQSVAEAVAPSAGTQPPFEEEPAMPVRPAAPVALGPAADVADVSGAAWPAAIMRSQTAAPVGDDKRVVSTAVGVTGSAVPVPPSAPTTGSRIVATEAQRAARAHDDFSAEVVPQSVHYLIRNVSRLLRRRD
jgi:tetratricopeptide (TPR) repeat protein